jgi:phosphohistidine phosphatase
VDEGLSVEAAVVSPAARTRATWSLLASASELPVEPTFDKGIYAGEVDDLADAVRSLPPDARCAVLVGHSPGCHEFVEWATDGQGDTAALGRMRMKFPTAAVALVSIGGPWADIETGCAQLLQFAVCRG